MKSLIQFQKMLALSEVEGLKYKESHMKFKIKTDDPLLVLKSTKDIVENLKYITINEGNLEAISEKISEKLKNGLATSEEFFGSTGSFEMDVQLIFLEDVVNFCFWNEKDKPKWQVEYPHGNKPTGGWYSLKHCFQRALGTKIPILDSVFLSSLTFKQVRLIFKGENGVDIPLVEKRLENLVEAGNVLTQKHGGKFINVLEKSKNDAITLVKIILDDFPSFRDIVKTNESIIYFLKRPQICAMDLSYLGKTYNREIIKNLDSLTAFADYKLPQMLRKFGVLQYSESLTQKVDNYVLIPAQSIEEIEIRAATIWGVELIRQKLDKFTAGQIDNALWILSQDQSDIKPHHRTYTTFY